MSVLSPSIKTFLFAVVLVFASAFCALAVGIVDDACQSVIESDAEEERSEYEDGKELFAFLSTCGALVAGQGIDESCRSTDENPLLSHSWRWCSRGPPAAKKPRV